LIRIRKQVTRYDKTSKDKAQASTEFAVLFNLGVQVKYRSNVFRFEENIKVYFEFKESNRFTLIL